MADFKIPAFSSHTYNFTPFLTTAKTFSKPMARPHVLLPFAPSSTFSTCHRLSLLAVVSVLFGMLALLVSLCVVAV